MIAERLERDADGAAGLVSVTGIFKLTARSRSMRANFAAAA
jgi:hypothetical protein